MSVILNLCLLVSTAILSNKPLIVVDGGPTTNLGIFEHENKLPDLCSHFCRIAHRSTGSSASTMTSAIIFGSTGAVGKHVKACLLKSAEITHVTEAARSVQSTDTQDKLAQIKLDDSAQLKPEYDLVFITLGTTAKNAGSSEKFEAIDRHLVVDLAKKVAKDSAHVVYCSSAGANANSSFLYPRSKGLTENALSELGYKSTTVMRPGLLAQAERKETRPTEILFGYVTGFLSKISSSIEIPVQKLGESMVVAGLKQLKGEKVGEESNNISFISNKAALQLSS